MPRYTVRVEVVRHEYLSFEVTARSPGAANNIAKTVKQNAIPTRLITVTESVNVQSVKEIQPDAGTS